MDSMKGKGSGKKELLLAIGVISAPRNFDRRHWLRHYAPALPGLTVTQFVLGENFGSNLGHEIVLLAKAEERMCGDIFRAPNVTDGSAASHVVKTLEWFRHASTLAVRWVVKTDDDTIWNVPLLLLETKVLGSRFSYVYHGVMRWRKFSVTGHSCCGLTSEMGPPNAPPKVSDALVKFDVKCNTSHGNLVVGPFPYADGSFELLSHRLVRALFRSSRLAAGAMWPTVFRKMHTTGNRAEDPAIGALVYYESQRLDLPVAFVALRGWHHNRFWLDLREPRKTVPTANTSTVHRVYNSMLARIAAEQFARGTPHTEYHCGGCEKLWKWKPGALVRVQGRTRPYRCCHRVPRDYPERTLAEVLGFQYTRLAAAGAT